MHAVNRDQRKEPRFAAAGDVNLYLEDIVPVQVSGTMVEHSKGGFRVAHVYPGLHPGQDVRFEHLKGQGRARVVWNRILAGQVESGFLVLDN